LKLYDIECYKNYFEIGIQDYNTNKIITFEVSEFIDQRIKMYYWLTNYKDKLISFNGLFYDNVILAYFVIHYDKLIKLDIFQFNKELKEFSNLVINTDDYSIIKEYKYYKHPWIDIDLFCYWSKGLRISKKISLKSLGIQLLHEEVQELPYEHDRILTKSEMEDIKYYNTHNDLGILKKLTTKMLEDIQLRENIQEQYNLKCLSWDAIKITSESMLDSYCEKIYPYEYKNLKQYDKEWVPRYKPFWKFKQEQRNQRFSKPILYGHKLLEEFNPYFELDIFKRLFERFKQSINGFSEELLITYNNTNLLLSYGSGGLHSVNSNEMYNNINYQIVTSDVGSLYPNLIINYNCIRFTDVLERYKEVKVERMIAKKNKDKQKDLFLKLNLNGLSGLLDNEYSWLYYPEGAMKLRFIGQLVLTKFIEECLLNNWQVISANTDGIEVLVPHNELNSYYKKLDEASKLFDLELEHEKYKFIYYQNVNSYLALTDSSKSKQKGLFVEEPVLGNKVDELVIAKALNNYFINQIPIKDSIENPNKYGYTIFDYCKSNKIDKTYTVWYKNQKVQNLNRYYFSKAGAYLLKKKHNKNTFDQVNVGEGVILYNKHKLKDFKEYNINYQYYIRKCNKIINELNSKKIQLTLF